jgi:hypothetical protein
MAERKEALPAMDLTLWVVSLMEDFLDESLLNVASVFLAEGFSTFWAKRLLVLVNSRIKKKHCRIVFAHINGC